MEQFTFGQKVKVLSWEELSQYCNLDNYGGLHRKDNTGYDFNRHMRKFCNKILLAKNEKEIFIYDSEVSTEWCFQPWMCKPVKELWENQDDLESIIAYNEDEDDEDEDDEDEED